MVTTLTQTHPLLTQPFSAATDFTLLPDYCEQFVETALESDDPALKNQCRLFCLCNALLIKPGMASQLAWIPHPSHKAG